LLIGEINDQPAREHFLARPLQDAGFVDTSSGFQMRRTVAPIPSREEPDMDDEQDQEKSA
jgi:hypothetical protein